MQRATGWKEEGRQKDDFYATPRWAIEELLSREEFKGPVWECACGDGAITKVLEEQSFEVISTDLRENDIYGDGGVDFLKENKEVETIITNPPFKLAEEFILHGLKCANKIAIFGRIQLLEGMQRYRNVWSKTPLKKVYVFSGRCSCLKDGKNVQAGLMCFAWFIWDKNYTGNPEIGWIYPKDKLEKEQKTLFKK